MALCACSKCSIHVAPPLFPLAHLLLEGSPWALDAFPFLGLERSHEEWQRYQPGVTCGPAAHWPVIWGNGLAALPSCT